MDNPKKVLIVANWKSNKTQAEAIDWLSAMSKLKDLDLSNKEIVVCPSFIHLSPMKSYIEDQALPIKLGAQNISSFDEGAYTGEVNGKQIRELADYVLIGHSERRRYVAETEEMLMEKVKMAKQWNLKVIFCADNQNSLIPDGASIVTYEPPNAISPAPADTPENAEKAAKIFKAKAPFEAILYGGSVVSANVSLFLKMSNIDGVLVGKASLDPKEFYEIIQNA
jgi:triosephosphate isomerase (TIM)